MRYSLRPEQSGAFTVPNPPRGLLLAFALAALLSLAAPEPPSKNNPQAYPNGLDTAH